MWRPIVFAVTLAMLLLSKPAHAEVREEGLSEYLQFAAEALKVPPDEIELPPIVYLNPEQMQIRYYGQSAFQQAQRADAIRLERIVGFYEPEVHIMYLLAGVDFTLARYEQVIVHEIVHVIQYELDRDKEVRCIEKLEREAYRISNLWAQDTGGPLVDAWDILMNSLCPRE